MEKYNILPEIVNVRVPVDIWTGMYSLSQSGRLAYIKLIKHLSVYRYLPIGHTPRLFHHITCPVTFWFVVDDFGVKYFNKRRFRSPGYNHQEELRRHHWFGWLHFLRNSTTMGLWKTHSRTQNAKLNKEGTYQIQSQFHCSSGTFPTSTMHPTIDSAINLSTPLPLHLLPLHKINQSNNLSAQSSITHVPLTIPCVISPNY